MYKCLYFNAITIREVVLLSEGGLSLGRTFSVLVFWILALGLLYDSNVHAGTGQGFAVWQGLGSSVCRAAINNTCDTSTAIIIFILFSVFWSNLSIKSIEPTVIFKGILWEIYDHCSEIFLHPDRKFGTLQSGQNGQKCSNKLKKPSGSFCIGGVAPLLSPSWYNTFVNFDHSDLTHTSFYLK